MTENLPPLEQNPTDGMPGQEPAFGNGWDERAARHARRREERAERRAARSNAVPWLGGAILVVLGVILLAQNLNLLYLGSWNWWALFILIPAIGAFAGAWNQYQSAGAWTRGARSALISGLVLTLVTAAFLFNADWGRIWPLLLILAGIGALLNGLGR